MQIFHGVDLVEVTAFETLLADDGGHLLQRCFHEAEVSDSGSGPNRSAKLAARFAAKEAVMKALGTGFSSGVSFKDVQVKTAPSGAPTIRLHGCAQERALLLKISAWALSTSHDGDYAIASVIGYAD